MVSSNNKSHASFCKLLIDEAGKLNWPTCAVSGGLTKDGKGLWATFLSLDGFGCKQFKQDLVDFSYQEGAIKDDVDKLKVGLYQRFYSVACFLIGSHEAGKDPRVFVRDRADFVNLISSDRIPRVKSMNRREGMRKKLDAVVSGTNKLNVWPTNCAGHFPIDIFGNMRSNIFPFDPSDEFWEISTMLSMRSESFDHEVSSIFLKEGMLFPYLNSLPKNKDGSGYDFSGIKYFVGDASFMCNTSKEVSFRALDNEGRVLFDYGPFYEATHNTGEFLALVGCLYAREVLNLPNVKCFSDSTTALRWVESKGTGNLTGFSVPVFKKMLYRSQSFLSDRASIKNLFHWDKAMGENLADYGKK